MEIKRGEMDRRTFMKSTLEAGVGLVLTTSTSNLALGNTAAGDGFEDLSLYQLSRMVRNGEVSSKKLVETYLDRIQKFGFLPRGMMAPEVEEIELGIPGIGPKMVCYKFLHGFLTHPFSTKINLLETPFHPSVNRKGLEKIERVEKRAIGDLFPDT